MMLNFYTSRLILSFFIAASLLMKKKGREDGKMGRWGKHYVRRLEREESSDKLQKLLVFKIPTYLK